MPEIGTHIPPHTSTSAVVLFHGGPPKETSNPATMRLVLRG